MSDQFYAVHFKGTQSSTDKIAVFSLESEAQWFFDIISINGEVPEDYHFSENVFVGIEEINPLDKPYEAFDLEILYINEWYQNDNIIPDVRNF